MVGIVDVRIRLHAITGVGVSGCAPSHSCATLTESLSLSNSSGSYPHLFSTSQSQMDGQRTLTASPEVSYPHRLAVPPSSPHLLSHSHVSLPSCLAPLAHATIAAFLSTAYCLVQLSGHPDAARTISRSPLAHLTPLRRRRQYRSPAAHVARSQTCRSRVKVTAHTRAHSTISKCTRGARPPAIIAAGTRHESRSQACGPREVKVRT